MSQMIVDTRSKNYMSLKREGNTFVRQQKRKVTYAETKYKYKDLDDTEYNIYITEKGKAFIIKETVNGVINKVYLPKEVSEAIIAENKKVDPSMVVDN